MEIGTQVGPYRIDTLLGKGGMAEVYKVWHTGLHRHEAMKVLPPQMTFDQNFVERFLGEARNMAGLQHPHIAAIHTVSEPSCPQPYFTMEVVEGGDLSDLLEARGVLPLSEALPILRQIGAALDYAHEHRLIHRDVKPANILLKMTGRSEPMVKVVDFGIARAQEDSGGKRLTKTGMIVGTPEYMSPEQGGSGAVVDHRTDQYSLAVIAYEMLCGQPPFKAASETSMIAVIMQHVRDEPRPPQEYSPDLTQAANAAILRGLAKNPADRFDSCSQFVVAMESYVQPKIPIGGGYSPSVSRKFPTVPVIVGLSLLAGAGLIGFGLNRGGENIEFVPAPSVVVQNPEEGSTNNDSSSQTEETPTESPRPEPPPPKPVAPATLVGTWKGTWPWLKNDVPSSLVVTNQDGDAFDGILTLFFQQGRSQVRIRGLVNNDRAIELKETEILAQHYDWGELSTSFGNISSDRRRVYGQFTPTKKWGFQWANSDTQVPTSY